MRKRILSVILAMLMLFILLPTAALAEEPTAEPVCFTVTFDLNGQTGIAPKDQLVAEGGLVAEPEKEPVAEGFVFTGWYSDKACGEDTRWDFEKDTVSEDMTLYAGWQAEQPMALLAMSEEPTEPESAAEASEEAEEPTPDAPEEPGEGMMSLRSVTPATPPTGDSEAGQRYLQFQGRSDWDNGGCLVLSGDGGATYFTDVDQKAGFFMYLDSEYRYLASGTGPGKLVFNGDGTVKIMLSDGRYLKREGTVLVPTLSTTPNESGATSFAYDKSFGKFAFCERGSMGSAHLIVEEGKLALDYRYASFSPSSFDFTLFTNKLNTDVTIRSVYISVPVKGANTYDDPKQTIFLEPNAVMHFDVPQYLSSEVGTQVMVEVELSDPKATYSVLPMYPDKQTDGTAFYYGSFWGYWHELTLPPYRGNCLTMKIAVTSQYGNTFEYEVYAAPYSEPEDEGYSYIIYHSNYPTGSGKANNYHRDRINSSMYTPTAIDLDATFGDITAPEGMRLSHWNTRRDGSGTSYQVGAELPKDPTVVLYAIWEEVPSVRIYTVTLDFNGHGGEQYYTMYTDERGILTSVIIPSDENFRFINWYKEPQCINAYDLGEEVLTGDTTLYAKWEQLPDIVISPNSGYTYKDGELIITGSGSYTLSLRSIVSSTTDHVILRNTEWLYLTLKNLTIDCSASGDGETPGNAAILLDTGAYNVTVSLAGTNLLKGGFNRAGMEKKSSYPLYFAGGSGSLTVYGGLNGAGIGGGNNGDAANIDLLAGKITAYGNTNGAGIGGGNNGSGKDIVIRGGANVTARGGPYAAGIGGGRKGGADGIAIRDGSVTAFGGLGGAGIGSGYGDTLETNITVSGGTVTAIGGRDGDGIGFGTSPAEGKDSHITVSGGTVVAFGGYIENSGVRGQAIVSGEYNRIQMPSSGNYVGFTVQEVTSMNGTDPTVGQTILDKVADSKSISAENNLDKLGLKITYNVLPIIAISDDIEFTLHPAANTTVKTGSVNAVLRAEATLPDGSSPDLVWYECDAQGIIGIDINPVSRGDFFSIPQDLAPGTYFYRCRAYALYSVMKESDVAMVTVEPGTMQVTFRVENGIWADNTTADKSVTVDYGETLTASQIPTPGVPYSGYRPASAGAWSPVPDTEAAVTANTTYTFTFAERETPAYDKPENLSATYGDTLADITLPGGWAWEDALTTSVGAAGQHTFPATFTPDDTENYKPVTGIALTVAVGKAPAADVAAPTATALTLGQTLAESTLTTGWVWADSSLAPTVGNSGYTAYYAIADDTNYDWSTIDGYDAVHHRLARTVEVTVTVTYTVTLSPSPVDGGTVSGGGTFDENSKVTVTAVPKAGYHFVKWTEGETELGTEAAYSFTVTADRSLVAVFERDYLQLPELPADAIAAEAWVDGQRVDLTDGKLYDLPADGSAQMVTTFTYSSDAPDAYPTAMYVWSLRYENGQYTATRIEELDNILKYEGMSIRVPNYGIRMITSVPNALRSSGLAGYTLEEYGTQVQGPNSTASAVAYKRGVRDSVFAQKNGRTQYTNVLVDFSTKEDCLKELKLRAYVVLSKDGETITLYGGWVQRSIWYVANQNKDSFPDGSAYDQYIEKIIAYKNS